MPTDRERTEAQVLARAHYWNANRMLRDLSRKGELNTVGLRVLIAAMRNACVAYHAGASWMVGASHGVAEAHARESARLRAEVERLTAERDEARSLADLLRDDVGAYAAFPWDGPDIAVCRTCGRGFDMSELDQVVAHEACGGRGPAARAATAIRGVALARGDEETPSDG